MEYMSSEFDARKTAMIAVVAMSGIFLTAAANAVPTLRLTQGASSVTVSDNGGGDINALSGVVTFSGAVGDFIVNTTTGITKPILGSATVPILDLNSINVNGNNAGTIVLEFSETDFTNTSATLDMISVIGEHDGRNSAVRDLWLIDQHVVRDRHHGRGFRRSDRRHSVRRNHDSGADGNVFADDARDH